MREEEMERENWRREHEEKNQVKKEPKEEVKKVAENEEAKAEK